MPTTASTASMTSMASMNTGHPRTPDADVVIVGAGLAGLAAAHELTGAGLHVVLLEADDRIGGRLSTDQVDGYRLDRGTGLLSPRFRELAQLPGLSALTLRPFTHGALVHADGRKHRIGDRQRPAAHQPPQVPHQYSPRGARGRPGRLIADRRARSALDAARALTHGRGRGAVSEALDLVRLRSALARFAQTPVEGPDGLAARRELPAHQALSERGLPSRTIDTLVRPLLSALLCDPELTTSSRAADLALHSFARDGLALPAGGLSAIPELLAAALPEGTVRTGVRVEAVTTHAVTTRDHGTIGCRAALVATGAQQAAQLLPGLRTPDFHPVTVLHHAAHDIPPRHCPTLLVDAHPDGPRGPGRDGGPVSHTWVSTAVDPSRALPGHTLVTSVVLAPHAAEPVRALDEAARPQLAGLYGGPAHRWELLGTYQEPYAVPAMPAPHDPRRPVRVLSGLYVCGDHRGTSTAQGAVASAGRAAREILRDFGVSLPADDEPALNAVA